MPAWPVVDRPCGERRDRPTFEVRFCRAARVGRRRTRGQRDRGVLLSLLADTEAAAKPRITGLGTAVLSTSYSQRDLLQEFGITDERVRSIFLNSAITSRGLTLPPALPDGSRSVESQGQLLRKHTEHGVRLAREAVEACLVSAGATLADVRHLCCITSTGFLTPGFSALLIKELGLDPYCSRLDVVGMGCNAGLNGLTSVAGWVQARPAELAVMVCVEVCSAAYVFDGTMRSSVVNSLFGDGAAAVAVRSPGPGQDQAGPALLRFSSRIIPECIGAMRYDWDDDHGRVSLFLHPGGPHVVRAHAGAAPRPPLGRP